MKTKSFLDLDQRYFAYLWPYRLQLGLTLVAMAGAALMDIAAPWPLKFIVDNVIGNKPFSELLSLVAQLLGNNPFLLSLFFVSMIVVLAGLGGLMSFTYAYLQGIIQEKTTFALRSKVFAHLQSLSLEFHDQSRSGELIGRVTKDAGNVMDALVHTSGEIVINALNFIGIAFVMFFVNWRFSIIALAFAPVLYFLFRLFRKKIKSSAEAERSEDGNILNVTHETLSAIRVVKAFGREGAEQRRFEEHGEARLNAGIRSALWESAFEPIIDLVKAVGIASVVGYGAYNVLHGQLSVGELLIFLSYLGSFYNPLKRFSKLAGMLQTGAVSGERLTQLLDTKQVVKDDPGAISIARVRGQVEFRQVSFSYTDSAPPALSDVSFLAKAGQKVAIIGATGAGKSTLANLLMRFYDPRQGEVRLDGTDIRKIKLANLRQQYALVQQEPLLFAISIRNNIAYGKPEASMKLIMEAAKAANAHEFIMQLPYGYATLLGERGGTLSIGQRQRIAIARAILQNAPILILDEPTAALDSVTEFEVMSALERLMAGRTTFIIAHRLSTIKNADLILVIEDGQLVEAGQHTDLLALGGNYAEFVLRQNGEPLPVSIEQSIKEAQQLNEILSRSLDGKKEVGLELERDFNWVLVSQEQQELPGYSTKDLARLIKHANKDVYPKTQPRRK
ncbi:MAG TPA: ABC transporter ATP-binding protein [Anaerolineales bacterium]